MLQRHRIHLDIEYLWPLVALAAFVCLGSLSTIDPIDFWWHLAVGRDIARSGAVPTVNTYNWTLPPNTPFIYGSWLAEWLLYGLYAVGGLPLIVLTRNLLLLATYTVVGLEARRRSGSWRLAALAIGGAGLITLNNLSVRPQIFAWLPFALTMLLVGAFRAGQLHPRWLLAVPLMMIGWVNLHGSFAIGLGFLGVTLGGELLSYVIHRRPEARARIAWLAVITGLSLLAILINPRGIMIVDFVRGLAGNPVARQYGNEWQPPDLLAFPGILLPLIVLAAILGWLRTPRRFNLADAALLAAFACLGISSIRNLIWFGMVAAPIVVGTLASRRPLTTRRKTQVPLLNYGIALSLCAPVVLVQPPFKAGLSLPTVFSGLGRGVADGVYMDASTPVKAIAWLREHPLPPNAHLFHEMAYGSYLMWALPDVPIAFDGRIELYPEAQWQRYLRIVRGQNARTEVENMGATHALLSRANQPELIRELATPGSGWQQRYADETTVFFERMNVGTER